MKPGVDPALCRKRLDEIMAEYHRQGPDRGRGAARGDERGRRADPRARAGRRLRRQGGRRWPKGRPSPRDSDFYKKTLAQYAAITPADVRTAMQQWLRRPALTIVLVAGRARRLCRSQGRDAATRKSEGRRAAGQGRRARSRRSASSPRSTSRTSSTPSFSNGIPVEYAQRGAVPMTQLALAFDAGYAADAPNARGLAALDHEPARRRHDVDDLAADRRGRGAAGRRGQHRQSARPLARQPVGAVAPTSRRRSTCWPTSSQHPAFAPAEVERVAPRR